jgi:hypothetical protein
MGCTKISVTQWNARIYVYLRSLTAHYSFLFVMLGESSVHSQCIQDVVSLKSAPLAKTLHSHKPHSH